jgi:cell division septum initiation protein DivIVA
MPFRDSDKRSETTGGSDLASNPWLSSATTSRTPAPDHPQPAPQEPAQPSQVAELQRRVEQLELELRGHRELEREVGTARVEAIRAAATIRQEARREAQAALEKAQARAAKLVAEAARERDRIDRELARRQALAEQTEHGLVEVLQQGLEQLKALSSARPPAGAS